MVKRLRTGLLPTTARYLREVAREHERPVPRVAAPTTSTGGLDVHVRDNHHHHRHPPPRRRDDADDWDILAASNRDVGSVDGDGALRILQASAAVEAEAGSSTQTYGTIGANVPRERNGAVDILGCNRLDTMAQNLATMSAVATPVGGRQSPIPEIDWCKPHPEASWSRRVVLTTTASRFNRAACNVCGDPTAGHCRGCTLPLCFRCARGRKECSAE